MSSNALFKILNLVPRFVEEFTLGTGYRWSKQIQKGKEKVGYTELKRPITQTDWENHFLGQRTLVDKRTATYSGSLAIQGKFADDTAKWFCLDLDSQAAVDVAREKLLPVYRSLNLDFLWEHSGTEDDEKAHLWFKAHCKIRYLKDLVFQMFEDAGLDPYDSEYQFELFPVIKENYVIRAPGGWHLKNGCVNPVSYGGTTSNDVGFIMESFINARSLSEAEVRLLTRPKVVRPVEIKRQIIRKGKFFYTPLNLPIPDGAGVLPPVIDTVARNCPAVNTMLHRTVQDNFLSKHGNLVHLWGLYLWRLTLYNDLIRKGKHAPKGEEWGKKFFRQYRTRDWEKHNWDSDKSEHRSNPERVATSCKVWDRDFGVCGNCPWKKHHRIANPKALFYGIPIEKEACWPMTLVDAATIRRITFPAVKRRVMSLVNNRSSLSGEQSRGTILVASPQGSGKSVMSDELAVELSRAGKNVLISVPSGELAMEHYNRIKALGGDPFVLMSHGNLFKFMTPDFGPCPHAADIEPYTRHGMNSRSYKMKFCKGCPFEEECPFPRQYSQAAQTENHIVIIQHKHFTATEAMKNILEKSYDVLMVDEAVVDQLLVTLNPTEAEWLLLNNCKDTIKWAERLAHWLRYGGKPVDHKLIDPTLNHMEALQALFSANGTPFLISEYIRFYNAKKPLDKTVGILSFSPLPTDVIPVTVILDATPPVEMYKIILDVEDIEVYGDKEILDYRKMNPNNKVIQVLDATTSKTSMRGKPNEDGELEFERLVELLWFAGDTARKEYADKKILITTYKEFEPLCREWLEKNFPDIMDRVLVSHMKVGTNEFDSYDVQFLLAGVYLSAQQYHQYVYRLKTIKNYWNQLKGRPQETNFYYSGVGPDANIERKLEMVQRVQAVGTHCYVMRYPQFTFSPPLDTVYEIVDNFMISKTQQALRLRYNGPQERITYVFDNRSLKTFLITDSVLEEELVGYLRYIPEED